VSFVPRRDVENVLPAAAPPYLRAATGRNLRLAAGSGKQLPVDLEPAVGIAMDWSSDGRFVLYRNIDPKTGWDIWAKPIDGAGHVFPVIQTMFDDRDGQFSHDRKWIAYQSNESAISRTSSSGTGPDAMRSASVAPSTSSRTSAWTPPDSSNP
jgi:hypothetical protein